MKSFLPADPRSFHPHTPMKTNLLSYPTIRIVLASLTAMFISHSAQAADFDWNQTDSPNDWSLDTNWTPTAAVGGPSAAGTSVLINTNIGGTSTINLFTTGNPGTATKTVGRLDIGDTDGSNGYTIATGTGSGVLNFDGNGSNAQLNQLSTSGNNIISAPITLTSSLDISNAAASNTLTLSTGGITSGTAGTKTLTTTTGNVLISGIIGNGSGTVAVVQDGAGTLTLSGANTFTGGLTVKNGTVIAGNSVSALGGTGTGAVTVGGGAGSGAANASLLFANSLNYANPITVASGGTGTYTIGNSAGAVTLSGGITLNNNATISETNIGGTGFSSGQYLNISGAITGSGNLTLAGNGAISTNNSGQPSAVNNLLLSSTVGTTGSITNSGTGTAIVNISGAISNASSLTQNSATSMLILSSANTYTGATNVNAGVLKITNATAISTSSAVNVASGATLQIQANSPLTAQTLTISGNGTSYSTGALESTNTASYLGNVILAADSTISSDLATTTLTVGTVGSTTITGSGKNLTVTGAGNTTLSGSLNTVAGTLTKIGTGRLTLSGTNAFTGLTSIDRGTLSLNISTALNGGGNITFGGGTLQYTTNNSVDYASRIINSTGPISIDTNGQSRTFSSGLAASNSGGLTKIGSGTLTLSGTNLYTGVTAVNDGLLAVSATSALPSTSSIFTAVTGALNQGGAYTGVQGWLDSGKLMSSSIGAIALTGSSSENINFNTRGFTNLMLGASTNVTYTGTITPGSAGYRLGGGAGVITLTNTNALTGSNALTVGARTGNGSSGGGVIVGAANDLTGATTVAASSLTFNSATAGVATSDVTVNGGTTLAINYASGNLAGDNTVTRAKSVQLNGATLTVTGNTGGNSTENITNALTISSGGSTMTLSSAAGKRAILAAGSFARNSGGTVLFRGTSLGADSLATFNVSSTSIGFGTGPTLNGTGTAGGSAGTSTVGILTGGYGDTTTGGNGLGSTGGLVTYDATKGVRLLDTSNEYTAAISSGQTQLDNVRYVNATASLVTTTLGAATSVNSLSFASTGTGGVTIDGAGALKINSGVVYNAQIATNAVTISNTGGLDFNAQEAIFLNSNSGTFTVSNVVSNATGLTKDGGGQLILSGTSANTYTGTTTVNGGDLRLAKSTGVNAVTGDLVINTGARVSMSNSDQIADTSNVTINGGLLILAPSTGNNGGKNETINNLTMTNGGNVNYGQSYGNPTFTVNGTATVSGGSTLFQNSGGELYIGGLTSLSDDGTLIVKRSQSPLGIYDGLVTLAGGLAITNTATGAYTPVTISPGVNIAQIGGKLFLNGDLTFTGNTTNSNTTTIDGITGSGPRGVLALGGTRTFNVGDGAAANDLTVTAPMVDGVSAGGLTKTGAGTLALTGSSSYTGSTTVTTGTLLVNNSDGSGLGAGNAVVNNGAKLGGSGAFSGTLTVNSGGTLAPGASIESLASGALAFTTGSTFGYEMDFGVATSVGADLQVVTGNLSLTGTVTLTLANLTAGTFADNTKFTLINYSGSWNNGLFTYLGNSLADDSTFSFNSQDWRIDYNASSGGNNFSSEQLGANFVTMTAVPEPATWALLAFSLTTVLVLRRRRA